MFFRPPVFAPEDDGTVSDDDLIDDGTVDSPTYHHAAPVDDGTVDFDDGTVSDELIDDGTVDSPVFRALAHYAH